MLHNNHRFLIILLSFLFFSNMAFSHNTSESSQLKIKIFELEKSLGKLGRIIGKSSSRKLQLDKINADIDAKRLEIKYQEFNLSVKERQQYKLEISLDMIDSVHATGNTNAAIVRYVSLYGGNIKDILSVKPISMGSFGGLGDGVEVKYTTEEGEVRTNTVTKGEVLQQYGDVQGVATYNSQLSTTGRADARIKANANAVSVKQKWEVYRAGNFKESGGVTAAAFASTWAYIAAKDNLAGWDGLNDDENNSEKAKVVAYIWREALTISSTENVDTRTSLNAAIDNWNIQFKTDTGFLAFFFGRKPTPKAPPRTTMESFGWHVGVMKVRYPDLPDKMIEQLTEDMIKADPVQAEIDFSAGKARDKRRRQSLNSPYKRNQ